MFDTYNIVFYSEGQINKEKAILALNKFISTVPKLILDRRNHTIIDFFGDCCHINLMFYSELLDERSILTSADYSHHAYIIDKDVSDFSKNLELYGNIIITSEKEYYSKLEDKIKACDAFVFYTNKESRRLNKYLKNIYNNGKSLMNIAKFNFT